MADPLVIIGISYAGKEAVAVLGHFLRELLGPSATAAGKGLAAPLEAWAERRTERAKEVLMRAAVAVEETGRQAQAVPGRVLWPILEKSSLEEDSHLQQRWVALLANAAVAPEAVSPAVTG